MHDRLISASIGTVVYYGFSCHQQAAWIYLSLCFMNAVLGSIFPFMKWFNMRKYKVSSLSLFSPRCWVVSLTPTLRNGVLYSSLVWLSRVLHQ